MTGLRDAFRDLLALRIFPYPLSSVIGLKRAWNVTVDLPVTNCVSERKPTRRPGPMSETATLSLPTQQTEHFDVLIVGAGISGVGGAYHLTEQCPDNSFVVLETLDNYGGTW